MGIYQYTLRADTKTVGGLEIAHYQFAYKVTGWPSAAFERRMDNCSRHAENARAKLRHVRHWVQGQWDYAADKSGLPVYACPDGLRSEFTEEWKDRPIVGVLRKVKGRYVMAPLEPWMIAHNDRIKVLDKA